MLGPTGLPVSSRTSMWPPLLPAVQAAKMTGADTLLTSSDDIARYGVYSLFPSSGAPQLCQPRFASASAGSFHPTHKVQSLSISDSLFGGYAFGGAPTPPPGSPYSPLRLELLSKTMSSSTTSSCITTAAAAANDTACWMEPLQVKTELPGCSRTTPAHTALLQVKREPQATPCQVSEISTSHHHQHHHGTGGGQQTAGDSTLATALVKMEANASPKSSDQGVSSIPVGIAVARQRLNQDVPLALAPGTQIIGATQTKETRCSEIGLRDPASMFPLGADTIIGTSMPSVWPVNTTQTSLGPPTLWQYPAQLPLEPVLPMPMPPVGVQLVRDPLTGNFILLPAPTTLEPFQQTVVWPNYLLPPPLQPLQLSEYLSAGGATTLHQHHHTQTHSTRLVALAASDATGLPKTRTTRMTSVKLEETSPGKQEAVVTAHLVYHQDAGTGTSPVACLTPPPETTEPEVQDASNQTDDAPLQSDEDTQSAEKTIICESEAISETHMVSTISVIEPQPVILNLSQSEHRDSVSNEIKSQAEEIVTSTETIIEHVEVSREVVAEETVEQSIKPKVEAKDEYESKIPASTNNEEGIRNGPDLSGLELLSNSIAEFETRSINEIASPTRENRRDIEETSSELDGLGLLCALAEKRFHEEVNVKHQTIEEKPCEVRFDELKRNDSSNITQNTNDMYENVPPLHVYEEKLAELKRQYKETLQQMTRLKPADSPTYDILKDNSELKSIESSPVSLPEVLKTPSPCPSTSSSKKRKVGRPKKLSSGHGRRVTTETIFAKKPKTKGGIVGYLLSGKSTLSKGGIIYTKSNPRLEEEDIQEQSTIKVGTKDNESCIKTPDDLEDDEIINEEEMQERRRKERRERKHKNKKSREKRRLMKAAKKSEPILKCALTDEHLEKDGLRVLCAMGGLFYAGRLSAVQAPDVYAVTLDGERGNRPHILSREEIMRDAFLELSPTSVSEVPPGTRLCAYWSQQYRCLYPGTSASPEGTPRDADRYVSVEFDDGDNGRIALEDIRLLEHNYPIVEYDPNPLLSLGKRKRRSSRSDTAETHKPTKDDNGTEQDDQESIQSPIYSNKIQITDEEARRERKRIKKLKKRRREEEAGEEEGERKRRKKHRCRDESCKRRHHKKHRRHRHRHRSSSPTPSASASQNQQTGSERSDIVRRSAFGDTFMALRNLDTSNMQLDEKSENGKEHELLIEACEADESNESSQINDTTEESVKSPMAAFLPARQLWTWQGAGRKGKNKKVYHRAIQRGHEVISVGDCAVFLSTASPTRPYIGRIECLWETTSKSKVRVRWFYHPEETHNCPADRLKYPGALFESPHIDENDVQTISHKCDVLDIVKYINRLGMDPSRYSTIYENNDTFYVAGHYEPTSKVLSMLPGVPLIDL